MHATAWVLRTLLKPAMIQCPIKARENENPRLSKLDTIAVWTNSVGANKPFNQTIILPHTFENDAAIMEAIHQREWPKSINLKVYQMMLHRRQYNDDDKYSRFVMHALWLRPKSIRLQVVTALFLFVCFKLFFGVSYRDLKIASILIIRTAVVNFSCPFDENDGKKLKVIVADVAYRCACVVIDYTSSSNGRHWQLLMEQSQNYLKYPRAVNWFWKLSKKGLGERHSNARISEAITQKGMETDRKWHRD